MSTGEGSSFPITRLASKYAQMQRDGRILSNRASIDIVRARVAQLAERIDLNDAPDRMARIKQLWDEYTSKLDGGMDIEAHSVRLRLDTEFEKQTNDYAAWKQMLEVLDLDSKLVEREVKIVKEIQAILTAEDAYQLAAKLLGAVINAVDDPKAIKRIQFDFTRIIGENPDRRSGSGSDEVIDAS